MGAPVAFTRGVKNAPKNLVRQVSRNLDGAREAVAKFSENCQVLRMNVGNAWEARKNSKNKDYLEADRIFSGIQD